MCRRVHTHARLASRISAGMDWARPQMPWAWLHAHSWIMLATVRMVDCLSGPTSSNRTGNVSLKTRPSSMSLRECQWGMSRIAGRPAEASYTTERGVRDRAHGGRDSRGTRRGNANQPRGANADVAAAASIAAHGARGGREGRDCGRTYDARHRARFQSRTRAVMLARFWRAAALRRRPRPLRSHPVREGAQGKKQSQKRMAPMPAGGKKSTQRFSLVDVCVNSYGEKSRRMFRVWV